ncbi:hypothetical protein ACET3Z_011565 [Daucus carota]
MDTDGRPQTPPPPAFDNSESGFGIEVDDAIESAHVPRMFVSESAHISVGPSDLLRPIPESSSGPRDPLVDMCKEPAVSTIEEPVTWIHFYLADFTELLELTIAMDTDGRPQTPPPPAFDNSESGFGIEVDDAIESAHVPRMFVSESAHISVGPSDLLRPIPESSSGPRDPLGWLYCSEDRRNRHLDDNSPLGPPLTLTEVHSSPPLQLHSPLLFTSGPFLDTVVELKLQAPQDEDATDLERATFALFMLPDWYF